MLRIPGLFKTAIPFLLGVLAAAPSWSLDLKREVSFSIPAQELDAALIAFSKQAELQVVTSGADVKEHRSGDATGVLTIAGALQRLLGTSGLSFKAIGESAISIGRFERAGVLSSSEPSPDSTGLLRLAQADNAPTPPATLSPKPEESENQSNQGISEILVRGSSITNVDVKRSENDAQPYYIFGSDEIKQSAATNIEDFLKQRLTMNTVNETSAQQFNPVNFGATSSINLRGLGSNETLVLIDGRRSAKVQNVHFSSNQPDVNSIPISAIERIEVLPTSASAIYGGAALGGVVNIVMKKQYNGGTFTYSRESPIDTEAPLNRMNAGYGLSFGDGKTNIMLSGSYSDGDALRIGDRENIIQRGITNIIRNEPSYLYSSSNPFLGATPNIASADGSNLVLKDGSIPLNSPITFVPAGAGPESNINSAFLENAGTYNLNLSPGTGYYGLATELGTVPRTKSFRASIRREMTSRLDAFVEISTASNSTRSFYNDLAGQSHFVPSTAPNNPFQNDVLVTIPSELSSVNKTNNRTRSLTAGIVARLSKEWSAGLDYTQSRNSFDSNAEGNFTDSASLAAALASGALNPLVDTIAYPLNLNSYLSPIRRTGDTFLDNVGLRASGSLGAFFWGRPTLTVGLEHRSEGFDGGRYTRDYPLTPAQNQVTVFFKNAQRITSVYVETNVPLVTTNNSVTLIRALDLQVAARSEKYSIDAKTPYAHLWPDFLIQCCNAPQGLSTTSKFTSTNPTIGIKYKPIDDVTFRASYARAFLPPTAEQLLLNPMSQGSGLLTDPEMDETYLVNVFGIGNPELNPQTSKAWSLGAIFEPQDGILKGLRVNLERYDIVQPDYITVPSSQQIVSNPSYASRVTRDPTTGRITDVDISYVNALEYKTAGWDLSLSYARSTAVGAFNVNFIGTHIEYDKRQYTIGQPSANYDGYPGEGGSVNNKANLTVSWERNGLVLGSSTTYYGSYYQVFSPGSPLDIQYGSLPIYPAAQGSNSIPSQVYHDLFGSFTFDGSALNHGSSRIRNIASGLALQFGIKNVLNTPPRFDIGMLFPYYMSPFGDVRLRSYTLAVTKSFRH